jgi:chorismate synthase
MKNSFGNSLTVTLFGESHGAVIGAVLDGIAPGIRIDHDYIAARMDERRPMGACSTARCEEDKPEFISGVYNGYTTGTPVCVIIKNTNAKSSDYAAMLDTPRPSHADYTARCKYHGFEDARGGGHFSGRVTAALVAAGAIVRLALENKGIYIGTHILRLGGINDRAFGDYASDFATLRSASFPTLDGESGEKMKEVIARLGEDGNSIGGVLETAVTGIEAGVGEPWFDTVEGMLAHALYSIPGIKGVEFGLGFGFADALGSDVNDAFTVESGEVRTLTNNNGGINGGITNGMPIIFRTAVKPTPSIKTEQNTISLSKMENTKITVGGRHDPSIAPRVRAVIDSVTAIVLADMLTTRFGTDYLKNDKL